MECGRQMQPLPPNLYYGAQRVRLRGFPLTKGNSGFKAL